MDDRKEPYVHGTFTVKLHALRFYIRKAYGKRGRSMYNFILYTARQIRRQNTVGFHSVTAGIPLKGISYKLLCRGEQCSLFRKKNLSKKDQYLCHSGTKLHCQKPHLLIQTVYLSGHIFILKMSDVSLVSVSLYVGRHGLSAFDSLVPLVLYA